MKTITKTTKAIILALLAMILCVATAFALTACNNGNDGEDTPPADGITKYDAVLDASITMGAAGPQQLGSNVLKDTYITVKDGKYTLTLITGAGEMTVYGITKNVFIDDNPENPQTFEGIKDGTVGIYKTDGTLVTEGVKLTYSSGDEYETTPSGKNVYFVKSAEFPVDGVKESYELTMFFNSPMMGKQFSNATYKATLTLDLQSGTAVESISGYGVAARGEVYEKPDAVEPVTDKYTKYEASLDAVISMGQDVNFTENLFDGIYVIKKDGKYELTLIFKSGVVNMPFGNTMTGFLTDSECPGYRGGDGFMPVWGYYEEETLVKDGVTLTYSTDDDYVTVGENGYYYVKSMTFAVDTLEEEYILSLCVMAGNETTASGQQFPYTSNSGTVCNAVLTLDLTNATTTEDVSDLLGADTLGEVSSDTEYEVPVVSLTSAAPLPAVKAAFNEAFGTAATLIVTKDGDMKLRLQNKHMVIDMSSMGLGSFDANVAWIQGATVISTKEEVFSNVNGNLAATPTQDDITVPDVFEIAYDAESNGVMTLTIGVDFMAKMNSKDIDEYSTTVTLTLDLSPINSETTEA